MVFMLTIDLSFEVTPAVGKTISRIYRDTRFSADKSPFRDCMWIVFRRPGADWAGYLPGYFLEIGPSSCRCGMGFYDAAPKLMARFRQQLDEDPGAFLEAIAWFATQDAFTLRGETYKRPIGQDIPEPIRALYQLRNFYVCRDCPIDDAVLSPRFGSQVMRHFGLAAPLLPLPPTGRRAGPQRASLIIEDLEVLRDLLLDGIRHRCGVIRLPAGSSRREGEGDREAQAEYVQGARRRIVPIPHGRSPTPLVATHDLAVLQKTSESLGRAQDNGERAARRTADEVVRLCLNWPRSGKTCRLWGILDRAVGARAVPDAEKIAVSSLRNGIR
jgi:uncharacterized protein (TIGR02453 family)